MIKDYHTNQYLFSEYLNYLSNHYGTIVFIDNIQYIPENRTHKRIYEIFRQLEDTRFLFTSYTLKTDMDYYYRFNN